MKGLTRSQVYDFATSKIQEVEEKIRNLNQMKTLLEDLAEKCLGSGVLKNQCPIMKKLSEGVN